MESSLLKTPIKLLAFKDKCYGAILGAFVGDAAGAVLEFFQEKITKKDVEQACKFEGGGILNVSPGQITDDSEMAMSLMTGILESEGGLLQDSIAKQYCNWCDSNPIDIGITTSTAIGHLDQCFGDNPCSLSESILEISNDNYGSKSNGCLMRITPLSVYMHSITDPIQIENYTKMDMELTHSNSTCLYATTAYNIAIVHLLNNPDDVETAMNNAYEYIDGKKNSELSDSWERITRSESDNNLISATKHIGYIMIAFEYAFYYLKHEYSYEDAIQSMLLKGGDTDTNAAIVGGLVGARVGANKIPQKWRDAVLNAKSKRPKWLQPQNEVKFCKMIDELIEKAESDLL